MWMMLLHLHVNLNANDDDDDDENDEVYVTVYLSVKHFPSIRKLCLTRIFHMPLNISRSVVAVEAQVVSALASDARGLRFNSRSQPGKVSDKELSTLGLRRCLQGCKNPLIP